MAAFGFGGAYTAFQLASYGLAVYNNGSLPEGLRASSYSAAADPRLLQTALKRPMGAKVNWHLRSTLVLSVIFGTCVAYMERTDSTADLAGVILKHAFGFGFLCLMLTGIEYTLRELYPFVIAVHPFYGVTLYALYLYAWFTRMCYLATTGLVLFAYILQTYATPKTECDNLLWIFSMTHSFNETMIPKDLCEVRKGDTCMLPGPPDAGDNLVHRLRQFLRVVMNKVAFKLHAGDTITYWLPFLSICPMNWVYSVVDTILFVPDALFRSIVTSSIKKMRLTPDYYAAEAYLSASNVVCDKASFYVLLYLMQEGTDLPALLDSGNDILEVYCIRQLPDWAQSVFENATSVVYLAMQWLLIIGYVGM